MVWIDDSNRLRFSRQYSLVMISDLGLESRDDVEKRFAEGFIQEIVQFDDPSNDLESPIIIEWDHLSLKYGGCYF